MKSSNITLQFILLFCIMSLQQNLTAKSHHESQNSATVIKSDLNVRSRPPEYSAKSMLTKKLSQGDVIAIVKQNQRVTILGKKLISGKYWWFKINYGDVEGWILGGEGEVEYLRFENCDLQKIENISHVLKNGHQVLLAGVASIAQDSPNEGNMSGSPADDDIPVNSFASVGICAANICLFLISLWFIHKMIFPDSKLYTLLVSLFVMVLLNSFAPEYLYEILLNVVS